MKIKPDKDSLRCISALIIIVISYAAERCIELYVTPTAKLGLLLALGMTALLCVVVGLLAKSEDSFTGLLAALIGYKMMPADISFLANFTPDGTMMYYLLQKAAKIVFIILVFRLYNAQERPRSITPLPLCAMLFAVPFMSNIGTEMTAYFLQKTGSMLGGFFSQYACYAIATLAILALAFVSTYQTMRFTAYFEFTALFINILRTFAKIIYRIINDMHISRSLYGWLILYVVLITVFFIAKSIKKKNVYNI